MNEIKKLTIHSTLWEKPIENAELDDAILNKLSVKGLFSIFWISLTDSSRIFFVPDTASAYVLFFRFLRFQFISNIVKTNIFQRIIVFTGTINSFKDTITFLVIRQ